MPFPTDTTWPAYLPTVFNMFCQDVQLLETCYLGPYTILLSYCFDPNSPDYLVALHPTPYGNTNTINYLVVFNVHSHPMLIFDIKDDTWADTADLCFKADQHTHHGLDVMTATCPLPHLWGLSLLGTSFHAYVKNVATGEVNPPSINHPGPGHHLPPDFLEGA